MKLYDVSLIIILSVIAVSALVTFVSYKALGPDSFITKDAEQVLETEAEVLIKKETGIDINLKPETAPATAVSPN